ETDFEVPALDDESGSQAVALDESDTDLESSDFDLALDDQDVASDEESASQVVALEEPSDEEVEAAGLIGGDLEAEEEVEEEEEAVAAAAPPAEWGPMPAIVLTLSLIFLFVVGFMGFELIRGMWGYRQPTKVTGQLVDGISRIFTDDLPKE